jgi:hypothetical protein
MEPEAIPTGPEAADAAPAAEARPAAPATRTMRDAKSGPNLPWVPQSKSVLGHLDGIDHGHEVSGWAFDIAQPSRRCIVELRVDGKHVAQTEAGVMRPDLRAFRLRPDCGFRISMPSSLFDGVMHWVEVWLQPENLRIGSPRRMACVIADHKTYPKTFSVDSILKLQDGAIDFDRVYTSAFLQRHGVRAAVAYAYMWLLKRPPDAAGWEHYPERLLAGDLGLGTFLSELNNSEEASRARRSGLDLLGEFEAVLAAAARLPAEEHAGAP